jgi:hypothetical protein
VSTARRYRDDALERHHAKLDPTAIEKGLSSADVQLPAGSHPRQVKVGMYLDSIASISILESTWKPVFYIWFRWTGEDLLPGESFNLVSGSISSKEKLSESSVRDEHYALSRIIHERGTSPARCAMVTRSVSEANSVGHPRLRFGLRLARE